MNTDRTLELINIGQNLKNKGSLRHTNFAEQDYFFGFQSNDEYTPADGGTINRQLYAHEGRQAIIDFAAGMHGNLTNPTQRWFSFEPTFGSAPSPESKAWGDATEDRYYEILNETNFEQQIHEFYIQLAKFNTACIYSEYDSDYGLRFKTCNMRNIYIAQNIRGEIDRVYNYYALTAKQIADEWEDVPPQVSTAINDNRLEDEFKVIHIVEPRYNIDPDSLSPLEMPWASYYILEEEQEMLSEGGFKENPYHFARFYVDNNDSYGTGPSFYMIPSIRQLDFYKVKNAENYEIQLNPTIIAPNEDYIIPDDTSSRTIIIADETQGQMMRKLDIAGDVRIGELGIANESEAIRRAFFLDRFNALQGITKEMTATETAQIINEATRYLGPVVGRMNTMLRSILNRGFRILYESGWLPQAPKELTDYKIRFESFLTRSQRATELADLDQWMARLGNMAQFYPPIVDKINFDNIADGTAENHGIKQTYIIPTEQANEKRAAQAKAAQEQQELDQLATLSQAAPQGA